MDTFENGEQRTYEVSKRDRIVYFVILNAISMLLILCILAFRHDSKFPEIVMADLVLFSLLAAMYLKLGQKVVVTSDSITLKGELFNRTLKVEDIAGWRSTSNRALVYIIVPKSGRKMMLPPNLKVDHDFIEWINQFPNLPYGSKPRGDRL